MGKGLGDSWGRGERETDGDGEIQLGKKGKQLGKRGDMGKGGGNWGSG